MQLTKLAMPSFDARRNKQYWQYLKRLHGGTDEAVQAIKETGDPHIWHGTRKELIPKIEEGGLHVGPFREFGKGTFFGDKATAELYGGTKVFTPSGAQAGNVWDKENKKGISGLENMIAYIKKHPEDEKYILSEGDYVRLAKPSELTGTKHLYPDASKVKVFDLKDRTLDDVARSQTAYMGEHDPTIKRMTTFIANRSKRVDEQERANMFRGLVEADMKSQPDFVRAKYDTPQKLEAYFQEEVGELMKLDPASRDFDRAVNSYLRTTREDLSKTLQTPRNDKELHQLQTYGKVRGKRLFERMKEENIRKEMFVDKTPIPPHLLRREDGSSFPVAPKEEAVAPTLPVKKRGEKLTEAPVEGDVLSATLTPPAEAERKRSLLPLQIGAVVAGGGLLVALAYKYQNRGKEEVASS